MGELNEIWSYLLENYYVIVRLLVAAFLGGIVGIERGKLNRPAGVRTHMIVCVGSALVMLLGVEMREIYGVQYANVDVTRLGAQVVSGIGFLGAGAILKDGFSVRGLTTAATLWVVACIVLAAGGGFYIGAIVSTILVYCSLLAWGNKAIKSRLRYLSVVVSSVDDTMEDIKKVILDYGIHISEIGLLETDKPHLKEIRFYCTIDVRTKTDNIILELMKNKYIMSVHLE